MLGFGASYTRGLTVFYILTLLSDCHTHVIGIGVYVGGDTLDMHSFRVGHVSKKKKKNIIHDDAIKWKHFPRSWSFVRGIHRSLVDSPHKGQ